MSAMFQGSVQGLAVCGVCAVLMATGVPARSQPSAADSYDAGRILVQPKRGVASIQLDQFHRAQGVRVLRTFEKIGHIQVLKIPRATAVAEAVAEYQRSGLVTFAEPDYVRHLDLAPNDPKYVDGTLWGLNNYGQNGGTPHADIDAPDAWNVLTSASNIVVAILDTGIRYTHEDLAANMWTNPVDGSFGTNAVAGTTNAWDDSTSGHGTLMAGVLGGVGNNGKGVVGVAWRVQLMACKCFNSNGSATDSSIIGCIEFARANGARVMSASFDSTNFGQALSNAIYTASLAGIIFVASAGNNSANIDITPHYPACFGIDNILSCAYSTRTDTLGSLSNYGATNVDLAAPGDQMYSTFNSADNAYWPPTGLGINIAGTSFAAAYVSGACALMLNKYPTESYRQIIARLLKATDPVPALAGKCVTGGRVNLRKALSPPIRLLPLSSGASGPFQLRVSCDANRTCVIQAAMDFGTWSPIYTNTTGADGTFDFTDAASTGLGRRFYRVTAAP